MATSASPKLAPLPANPPAPIIVSVSADGSTLMRGIVTSISGNTIMVESWGGLWSVRTDAATTYAPTSGSVTVGDEVGIIGTASATDPLTLNATFVRDWTTAPLQ